VRNGIFGAQELSLEVTPRQRSQSSLDVSSTVLYTPMPALFTKTSMRPNLSRVACIMALTSSSLETSHLTKIASPPDCRVHQQLPHQTHPNPRRPPWRPHQQTPLRCPSQFLWLPSHNCYFVFKFHIYLPFFSEMNAQNSLKPATYHGLRGVERKIGPSFPTATLSSMRMPPKPSM